MADFRTVQTRMWREDEWFQNLEDNDARMLWVYLFTNPSANAAGLYRLPLRTIAFEAHLELSQAERLLTEFATANKAYYENGTVYVVKMQALQHGDISWQVATRIAADVDTVPDGRLKQMYLERYGYPIVAESLDSKGKIIRSVTYRYPIDAVSMPHRYTDTVTDTDTDRGTGTDTSRASAQAAPAAATEPHIASAFEKWRAFGVMISGPEQSGEMLAVMDDLHAKGVDDWWGLALKRAGDANKRSWAYVRGTLKSCLLSGLAPGIFDGQPSGNGHAPQESNVDAAIRLSNERLARQAAEAT